MCTQYFGTAICVDKRLLLLLSPMPSSQTKTPKDPKTLAVRRGKQILRISCLLHEYSVKLAKLHQAIPDYYQQHLQDVPNPSEKAQQEYESLKMLQDRMNLFVERLNLKLHTLKRQY